MIGSFWNLCRACPSMPVDKQLHSEYRSTYRWHEFTGNSRPEVVRRAPIPNQFGPTNEPPLPRRKKCPELAYKSHEFIIGSEQTSDSRNNVIVNRARSEERGTPSRRSKSEGPPAIPNGRAYPNASEVDGTGVGKSTVQAGESSGLFKKTITKLSTEYRLQFVWPNVRKTIKGQPNDAVDLPKKSLSMGAIKSSQTNAMPTVHKKRTTNQKEATLHELEPLVSEGEDGKHYEKYEKPMQVAIVEKKSSARPFSQTFDQERMNHFLTRKENFGFEEQKEKSIDEVDNKHFMANGTGPPQPNLDQWYKDVVELRKKAGEYKCRGWGIEIDPDLYKKQKDLWDQVSKRSSLSALSLASSIHRPITKEEKEQENNKKSVPFKAAVGAAVFQRNRVPGQAHLIDNKDEYTALPARFSSIRHHLERTTGPDVEEGALLPSPTREKLMPAIPKSRESESQRGSPKKTAASRHGSPQKGSPQKGSPKKVMIKTRSQSVGPGVENESPKRQIRSSSTAPAATKSAAAVASKKTPVSTPTTAAIVTHERKPRPSTLSTSLHSRIKSSSLPPTNGRAHSVPGTNHHIQLPQPKPQIDIIKSPQPIMRKKDSLCSKSPNQKPRPKTTIAGITGTSTTHTANKTTSASATANHNVNCQNTGGLTNGDIRTNYESMNHLSPRKSQQCKLFEHDSEDIKDTAISVSSCSPQPVIPDEPIVKSPPEPTRVKSPEQIIMRSPDPVNWTVPLDTGKTFTVTQNVKEGETYSRPQSEIKASTPVEKPPPAPQSAPPELTEQTKMDAWKSNDITEPKSSISSSPTAGALLKTVSGRHDTKPVPGSTLRCLEDPSYDVDTSTGTASSLSGTARTTATDVLEKARDRFDRFWGGNKEDNV